MLSRTTLAGPSYLNRYLPGNFITGGSGGFLRAKAHTLTATYDLGEEKIRVHVSEVQTDESEFSLQRTVLSH